MVGVETILIVLGAVVVAAAAVLIPLALVHAVNVVLPAPPQRDDGVYGFFGMVTTIKEGEGGRPVPVPARFEFR
jgi:hypothetical protein